MRNCQMKQLMLKSELGDADGVKIKVACKLIKPLTIMTRRSNSSGTPYTVKHNKRYTLAITMVRKSDSPLDVLKRLRRRAYQLGLKIKRLYLDRGFDNNAIITYLKAQSFPAIMPLTIRGKTGGTRALLKGRKSYRTSYTRESTIYLPQTFDVVVVCKYNKGRYRRHGLTRFAFVVIGNLRLTPHQIFDEYRFRFGIETSYRLMNQMRVRTTSKSPAVRLFYVGLSLLLLNLWSFTKWTFLYVSKPGPRQVLHALLPLARWRLWLWEVVKLRLGFIMEIVIPSRPIAVY
jgi:putative transposase